MPKNRCLQRLFPGMALVALLGSGCLREDLTAPTGLTGPSPTPAAPTPGPLEAYRPEPTATPGPPATVPPSPSCGWHLAGSGGYETEVKFEKVGTLRFGNSLTITARTGAGGRATGSFQLLTWELPAHASAQGIWAAMGVIERLTPTEQGAKLSGLTGGLPFTIELTDRPQGPDHVKLVVNGVMQADNDLVAGNWTLQDLGPCAP